MKNIITLTLLIFGIFNCSSIEYYSTDYKKLSEIKEKILVLPGVPSAHFEKVRDKDQSSIIDNYLISGLHGDPRFITADASDEKFKLLIPEYKKWLNSNYNLLPANLKNYFAEKYKTEFAIIPILICKPKPLTFHAQTIVSKNQNETRSQTSVEWKQGEKIGVRYQLFNIETGEIFKIAMVYSDSKDYNDLLKNFLRSNYKLLNSILEK